ncbi:MAG: hypothetical protein AB1689_02000 [Thermodesulfobacteriota bacterium]
MAERRVVRDVTPEHLRDLLEHPPRASLTLVVGDALEQLPVTVRHEHGRYRLAAAADALASVPDQTEAVLLIDDGWHWFELRGVSVRGRIARLASSAASGSPAEGASCVELVPRRTIAWDYGTLREERA